MSPLWAELALARAAWDAVDDKESVAGGNGESPSAIRPKVKIRPVRRVRHFRLSSSFAL